MAAQYQLAHDGFAGRAYSGVISGGKFIACAAGSKDWDDYVKWVAEGNKPDAWRSPADGGQAITPKDGDVVVGSMFWSIAHYDPEAEGFPPEAEVWSSHMLNDPPPTTTPAHAPTPAHPASSSTTGSGKR